MTRFVVGTDGRAVNLDHVVTATLTVDGCGPLSSDQVLGLPNEIKGLGATTFRIVVELADRGRSETLARADTREEILRSWWLLLGLQGEPAPRTVHLTRQNPTEETQ